MSEALRLDPPPFAIRRARPHPRVAVMEPRPVRLPIGLGVRRIPSRPPAHQGPDFAAKYDDETLFFDAFPQADGRIALIGPPFLNLAEGVAAMTVAALPSGRVCTFERRDLDRHAQIFVDAPAGTNGLVLETGFGRFEVALSLSELDVFAGRRVIFTLSKNNRLAWIEDWLRYARDVHGADAALIYDNGSTRYGVSELAEAVANIDGFEAVRIVSWPFKYGPQGLDAVRFWDSDYCQHGAWEHARRRFLHSAASAQNADIDELVVSPVGASVFDAAEADRFGIVRYHGRWVVGLDGEAPEPGSDQVRHNAFHAVLREEIREKYGLIRFDSLRCPPKWTVVPHKVPDSAQWRVHTIGGWWPARRATAKFGYRHFREINDNWKYARSGRDAFDAARHEEDALLARHLAGVRWDR